ncbi:MAG: SulP family inorganic anion transporter, partial [Zoogloea sp.]|nr:SulP family inorganic anion transporter [Zoogloea sp.]
SHPVLHGFNNACALLICISQVPALLGLPAAAGEGVVADVAGLAARLAETHAPSAAIGLGSIFGLVLLRRLAPRLPGILLVVAAATLAGLAFDFGAHGGKVVGTLAGGAIAIAWPSTDLHTAWQLLPAACVVALVSFVEAMASCKAAAARTRQRWDANQELIGQGLAKLTAGCVQAYPVSGSFGRSALLLASRVHTGLASVTGAAIVLMVLLTVPELLAGVPRPALAAVVLVTVGGLLDPKPLRDAWRARRDDGVAGVATLLATLATSPHVETGLTAGWLLSLALMVYRGMRPRVALLGLHPDGTYRDAARFGLPPVHPAIVILRFDGPLHFVNSASFEDAVMEAVRSRPGIRVVLVAGGGINEIDASGVETLLQVADRLAGTGVRIAFCGLKKQVIEVLERTGAWDRFAASAGYRTETHALQELAPTLGTPGTL